MKTYPALNVPNYSQLGLDFRIVLRGQFHFSSQETSILFSIIAAIIHIGDIDFMEDYSDRHMAANSKVSNYQQLQISKYSH